MPLIVGWLVEMWGFQAAFLAAGLFLILIGAGTKLWFRLCALDERSLSEYCAEESQSPA